MQDELQSEAWQFKVIVIGNSDVGKSSLLRRFHFGVFEEVSMTTIGAEVVSHDMVIDGQLLKLELWDTTGQERFRSIVQGYYRNADAALLVFDRSRSDSFEELFSFWAKEVKERCSPDAVVVIVSNKSDLKPAVSMDDVRQRCDLHNLHLIETSCKSGDGVDAAFNLLGRELAMRRCQDSLLMASIPDANLNSFMLHTQDTGSAAPASGYCCSYV